jgi:translation initiation factor IF-2
MTKKLFKIAKELNVATSTIVEFLNNSGFEIENKPIAKISDEMYDLLLDEFSSAIAEKERADQLLQQRLERKRPEGTPSPEKPVKKVEEEEKKVEKEKKEEKVVEKEEGPKKEVEQPKEAEEEIKEEQPAEEEEKKLKLKVVGKIDLDAQKKRSKKKIEEKKEEDEKVDVVEMEKVEEVESTTDTEKPVEPSEKVEEKKKKEEKVADKKKEEEKEKPVDDGITRIEAPKLAGLKKLGKVDLDKLQPKEKKKDQRKKDKNVGTAGDSDPSKKRRKRKRKKVNIDKIGKEAGRRNRRKTDEVKEVSQKEIDDKIKATMARLQGGGKSKRQKIRKDSRETKREKQELKSIDQESAVIELTEFITVSELASLMNVEPTEVIMTCFNLGVIVSINQRLDKDVIELLAEEFGHEISFISAEDVETDEDEIEDKPEDMEPRAPIVTVMGHVDHGKTSLLDYIREANVAAGEAGGITQHIGAYEVIVGETNKKVTFLDTPGHEAFTAMRARGAKITDIVIIIVAADDKIMPQTKEAISHAQAAGVSIVFAINKIDKPGADPERIKQELASMNLLVEEWGGKFQSQDISAKTGQGIEELLEKVVLEAEILELKANPNRPAVGTVIEASLDKGRGYITKVLVQKGTLSVGDMIVSGEYYGKVKALFNEKGKKVKKVGPSSPILVLGFNGASQAGEKFKEVESDKEAKNIAAKRAVINREQSTRAQKRISLDEIGRRIQLGNFKELNLIVKGDVDGSVEALSDSLQKLSIESLQVNIVHKAVGQITESDVLLATASDAIIVGFQVRPSGGARKVAEKEGVQIRTYSVIYEAIDEIKLAMEGMLEPTQEEKILGLVEVRETYKISKVGTIAGCYVTEGKVTRNSMIRLIREGVVVYPTKEGQTASLASLKRFKEDAREIKAGLECGLSIENYNDIKVGDEIEAYEIVEVKSTM